jgi:branched-chain amino acid aminotransferase
MPYGPLSILPSAQVLNYGQAIFEGMKAQESEKGRVVLFRPEQNAARFKAGALRMSMPPVPEDMFVEAVKELVRANLDYVRSAIVWALSFVTDNCHVTHNLNRCHQKERGRYT